MRATIPYISEDDYCNHFKYVNQTGGGEIFRGRQLQVGSGFGSFLRTIVRKAIPLLKKATPHLLKAATGVASSVIGGQSVGKSVKKHSVNAIKNFANDVINGNEDKSVVSRGHKRKNKESKGRGATKKPRRGLFANLFEAY